ncbi:MAG: hypothetical protein AAFQ66_00775 [Pseudomonadota bacterium]
MRLLFVLLFWCFYAVSGAAQPLPSPSPLFEGYVDLNTAEQRDTYREILARRAAAGDGNAAFLCGIDGVVRASEVIVRQGLPLAATLDYLSTSPVFGLLEHDAFADADPETREALLHLLEDAPFAAFIDDVAAHLENGRACLAAAPHAPITMLADLSKLRTDVDGDGLLDEPATPLADLLEQMASATGDLPTTFVFDRTDGYWLEAYLNATLAPLRMLQAFDHGETREILRDLIRRDYDPVFLDGRGRWWSLRDALSISALVSIRWPLTDAEAHGRMIDHLKAVPDLGRRTWLAAMEETDDRLEWLPGPGQTSPFSSAMGGGFENDTDSVQLWLDTLGDAEAILDGSALIPMRYVGLRETHGLNMASYIGQQTRFDLGMILTARDLLDHIEEGPVLTRRQTDNLGDLTLMFLSMGLFR